MSLAVRKRDHYCCQACYYNLDGAGVRITTRDLSVHHIHPLSEAYDRRLDEENLITLCAEHHEQAEQGLIKAEELEACVREGACGVVG